MIQLKHTYVQCLGGCVRETNDKVVVGSAVLEGRVGVVVIVVRSTRPQSEDLVTWKEAGSKLSCYVHQLALDPCGLQQERCMACNVKHSITNALTTLQYHSKRDMCTRGSTTTGVAHPCKGNITIWCKHLIGLSTTVKASTRTEGHDHNLVVAEESKNKHALVA